MNELQKENDLLRTNILLTQASLNEKEEVGDHTTYPKQQCSELCNNKLLEQRVSMLEQEHLKNRIERLEANNVSRGVTSTEKTKEIILKGNLSKLIEAQQEIMNIVQTVLNRNKSETRVCNPKQTVIVSQPIDLGNNEGLTSNLEDATMLMRAKEVGKKQQQKNEIQPTVVILDDEAQTQKKDCYNATGQTEGVGGNLGRKVTPSVREVEGVPIKCHATAAPQPFCILLGRSTCHHGWGSEGLTWQARNIPRNTQQRDTSQSWRTPSRITN